MMITIAGTQGMAENKDYAREIREKLILPSLIRGEDVILDFVDVNFATQSFIHAMIGEALNRFGEAALGSVEFRNCSDQLRTIVELVVDYSLGGFSDLPKSTTAPRAGTG